jgi:glycine/D-amino acid oxidase-like deaminating enzyme
MQIHSLCTNALGTGPWSPLIPLPEELAPSQADVVIVGAGVTGLSAARALAGSGISIVVVDRDVGDGATSRSGGIILGDTLTGPAPEFDGCELTLGNWIERRGIQCDFMWTRCLELAHDADLPPDPIDWFDRGIVRAAGVVTSAVLDPALLLNNLLAEVRCLGVSVVSGFEVEGLSRKGDTPIIIERTTRIAARSVLMATDAVAWRCDRLPWIERTLTTVLQTSPAPRGTIAAIGLEPRQPFYTRELPLLWGRAMRDGSLLFGRELTAFPWGTPREVIAARIAEAGERLAMRVRGLHPRLAELDVQRVWAGPTARTAQGVPVIVEDEKIPHVHWIGGYGGHGLAQAFTLGQLAAASVLADLGLEVASRK